MPSLGAALELVDPDVVHLPAEPDTALARQVAQLCRRQNRSLLIETDRLVTGSLRDARRARPALAAASAAICRSASALAALRRLGLRGAGIIAPPDVEASPGPSPAELRQDLDIRTESYPVIGWCGFDEAHRSASELLEALALGPRGCIALIDAATAVDDTVDRADALEVLPAIRLVSGTAWLSAIDVLVVPPVRTARARARAAALVGAALASGVPVIHPPLPEFSELVGAAGWAMPENDPVLLARLLEHLVARPDALALARAAAPRFSAADAAALFARAVHEAAQHRRLQRLPLPGFGVTSLGLWGTTLARRLSDRRPLARRP